MISVTGGWLSRARLGDRFSEDSRFALRALFGRNDRPFRVFRASTRGCSSFIGVTRDALGLEDEPAHSDVADQTSFSRRSLFACLS